MQDIKEREFRDSESITNTEICFEVRATTLRPRLNTERFPLYVYTGPSTHKRPEGSAEDSSDSDEYKQEASQEQTKLLRWSVRVTVSPKQYG